MRIIIRTTDKHVIFINQFIHFIHVPNNTNDACYYIFLDNDAYYLTILDKNYSKENKKAYNDYLYGTRTHQITLYASKCNLRSRLRDKICQSCNYETTSNKKENTNKTRHIVEFNQKDKHCQVLDKYEDLKY